MKNSFQYSLSLILGMFLLLTSCWSENSNGSNIDLNPERIQDSSEVANILTDTMGVEFKYLALGDSYTIGESVPEHKRWPVQLTQILGSNEINIDSLKIIARTGWTTDELLAAIKKESLTLNYDLVSLLIGVNNQYRGYPFKQYEEEFEALLNQAITFARNRPERVFVVSIPDYGVTPFGATRDPETIAKELDQYNAKAKEISEQYNVAFYDITPYSRLAKDDLTLVAGDQLHPSGKMYTGWVDIFWQDVKALLED